MNPQLLLAVIAGGVSGVFTNLILNAGLVSAASPGSIIAIVSMAAPGDVFKILLSVAIATVVSFLIASVFVKRASDKETGKDLNSAEKEIAKKKAESKAEKTEAKEERKIISTIKKDAKDIKKIIFACDAGMGSSAMGASRFKNRIKGYPYDVVVSYAAVAEIPEGTDVVVTNKSLIDRVDKTKGYEIIAIDNFLSDKNIDELAERFKKYMD